jgi:type IV secretion system T-DNA border endonuclease VirD2
VGERSALLPRPGAGPGLAAALIGEIGLLRQGGRVRSGGQGSGGELGAGFRASPRARTMWQLTQSSNAVVLKKIARGGTTGAASLKAQMSYLFSKAEGLFGNMVVHDPEARSLSDDERETIVTDWSAGWRGAPKNGHTTHLLISFPSFVKPAKAMLIAEVWAAEMFQSGAHQDEEWAYVAALHNDRSHPHVHVVVNNRGLMQGSWFFMAKDHAFNLATMKERLAAIAEEERVYLDTSSRRDRGILSYGPNRAEIERAARERRAPREVPYSGAVLEAALADVRANAAVLKDLAMVAELGGLAKAADRMRDASMVLARGGIIQPLHDPRDEKEGGPPMQGASEGRTVSDEVQARTRPGLEAGKNRERGMDASGSGVAMPTSRRGLETFFSAWIARSEDRIAALPAERQAPLWRELRDIAADVVRTLGDSHGAELLREAPVSRLHAASLDERSDSRATLKVGTEARELAANEVTALKAALKTAATEAGIDPARVEAQLARPATSAFRERDRVAADLRDMAQRQSLDLDSEEGRGMAARRVDAFYGKAGQIIDKVMGIDRTPEVAAGLPNALKAMAGVRDEVGLVRFGSSFEASEFGHDMAARYGKTAIADLARGKDDALKRDFPDPKERIAVARAVMAVATWHESVMLPLAEAERGQKLWEARAKELEASTERQEPTRERERRLTRDRDREL